MKNEILIGRQVDQDNFLIDQSHKSVGRVHAKIIRKPNGIYIEDMGSIHGTFVNGVKVKSKKIIHSDVVVLGGPEGCELDINAVLAKLPMSDEEFNQKVGELKDIFEAHRRESAELHSKMQSTMIVRMAPTIVLGSLTTLLSLSVGDDAATKTVIAASGAVLSILAFVVASMWATKRNKALKDEQTQLEDRFELEYVCPSCGAMFRGKSWETIKRGGKCPACKKQFNI